MREVFLGQFPVSVMSLFAHAFGLGPPKQSEEFPSVAREKKPPVPRILPNICTAEFSWNFEWPDLEWTPGQIHEKKNAKAASSLGRYRTPRRTCDPFCGLDTTVISAQKFKHGGLLITGLDF